MQQHHGLSRELVFPCGEIRRSLLNGLAGIPIIGSLRRERCEPNFTSFDLRDKQVGIMPLFEIETDSHIIITWAGDEEAAREVVIDAYPTDRVIRLTKRPRDTWVISKGVLGLSSHMDICGVARECLSKSSGDKLHAIRLYMHETGSDLEKARKVIETNMVMGW